MKKYNFRLKNGLNILAIKKEGLNGLYLIARVRVGHLYDPKGKHGLTHLLEHLLGEGTKNFPSSISFSSFIENLGGSYGLLTGEEYLDFRISLPINYLEEAIYVTREILFEPLFNNFQKEKCVIEQEIKERGQSIRAQLLYFIKKSIFKKDSILLYPLYIDDMKYLNNIKEKDIFSHWQKFFIPSNIFLAILGNFELRLLKKYLNKYFSNINRRGRVGVIKISSNDWKGRKFAFNHNPNLKTTNVNLIIPSIGREYGIENLILQLVILDALAGIRNSRLFKILRQERGLIYDIYFGTYFAGNNFGYVYIEFESEFSKVKEILSIIFNEIKTISKAEEIELVKEYLINRYKLSWDDPRDYLIDSLSGLFYFKKLFTDNYLESSVRKITKKDVEDFIKKHWDFRNFKLIIQSNEKNVKDLHRSIIFDF